MQSARFSPEGTRVAYLHSVEGKPRLSTAGFRGEHPRLLSAFQSVGRNDGGLDPDAGIAPGSGAPQTQMGLRWLDGTRVGWVTFVGTEDRASDAWELYSVQDAPGATPELVMHCANSRMVGFDFLPDSTVLAAARHPARADASAEALPGAMNLVVYRANAATKECEIVRALTQNTAPDSVARDLALSNDKTMVAFFSGVGGGEQGGFPTAAGLYTVPVDGSRPAAPVPGAEGTADLGIGPRWISGGSAITWGQLGQTGRVTTRVIAIAATGGEARVLAGAEGIPSGDNGTPSGRYVFGIGKGCSMTSGSTPLSALGIVTGLGMVAMLAGRRRPRG